MLLAEGHRGGRLARQAAAAQELIAGQRPRVAPLIEGWDVAGWASQPESLGGAFYDWLSGRPRESSVVESARLGSSAKLEPLHLALGEATECLGLGAALVAQSIRAAWRAHAEHLWQPSELVERVNRALWSGSAGEQRGSLFSAQIESGNGLVSYAWAGHPGALRLRPGSVEAILGPQLELGADPETPYARHCVQLAPGEALVVYNEQFRNALDERGRLACFAALAEAVQASPHISTQQLAELLAAHAEHHAVHPELDDQAVLVVRRRQ
jgi:serine phosphatase RsbU (regulator of sigma subunit)